MSKFRYSWGSLSTEMKGIDKDSSYNSKRHQAIMVRRVSLRPWNLIRQIPEWRDSCKEARGWFWENKRMDYTRNYANDEQLQDHHHHYFQDHIVLIQGYIHLVCKPVKVYKNFCFWNICLKHLCFWLGKTDENKLFMNPFNHWPQLLQMQCSNQPFPAI